MPLRLPCPHLPLAPLSERPLLRLLAVNLAGGVVVAFLAVGGLLLINPGGLRDLIFEDRSPTVALALLVFGFVISFASAAMGTAIMAIGKER